MDCPTIPELAYTDFSARLRQRMNGERMPITGSMELNFRCNLRCQHCYVSHGHTGIPGKDELSLSEIRRIMDELADAGCLWLLLTGGEPLMRHDFKEIYLYAKQKGFLVTLFTNATMLTPQMADFLAEYRPFNLEITLYGRTQETYECVTGIPGSHRRCYQGIELLRERKIPFRLKTMVMTLNQHELKAMQQYAQDLGVVFRYDGMLNAGVDGCGRPLPLRVKPQEFIQIEVEDPGRAEGWREFSQRFTGLKNESPYLYACNAGVTSFHIDPYGQLSLCMMSRQKSYNLRTGSFYRGWDEFLRQERYKPAPAEYDCNQCSLLPICGQCPGWSFMEHGEEDRKVAYLCQAAHLRARAFELQ